MSRGVDRPPPTRDLDTVEEIAEMVRRFYADVAQDDVIGPLFNDVARVDWSEHLPKLTAFWSRALLGVQGYAGNPFRAHSLVDARSPFALAHFDRWLSLFHDTVELGWTGPNAQRALALAHDVARVHSHQLVGTAWTEDRLLPAAPVAAAAAAPARRPLPLVAPGSADRAPTGDAPAPAAGRPVVADAPAVAPRPVAPAASPDVADAPTAPGATRRSVVADVADVAEAPAAADRSAVDGPVAAPPGALDPSEMGGDPACWAGLVEDHRDRPPGARAVLPATEPGSDRA
jgi:hemoglobin